MEDNDGEIEGVPVTDIDKTLEEMSTGNVALIISKLEQPSQAVAMPSISERLLYHAEQIEKLHKEMEDQGFEHLWEVKSAARGLKSIAGQFLNLK